MTSLQHWYLGARPKTLPAAIAPVLVASSLSFFDGRFNITLSALAALVALSLQIGVNYALMIILTASRVLTMNVWDH